MPRWSLIFPGKVYFGFLEFDRILFEDHSWNYPGKQTPLFYFNYIHENDIIFSNFLFILISSFSFAKAMKETSKEAIKVWGNFEMCKMCKMTIEKTSKSAGTFSATRILK
jgi:hypothetical protein